MVRSEAPVQNSLSVHMGQGLQDSLGVLHQGGQGRPPVPVAHTPSLAPHLLPVATTRTVSAPSQLSQSQSAHGQSECSLALVPMHRNYLCIRSTCETEKLFLGFQVTPQSLKPH